MDPNGRQARIRRRDAPARSFSSRVVRVGTTQATLTDGARGTGAARRSTWRMGTQPSERLRSAGRTDTGPVRERGSNRSGVSRSQTACHSGSETLTTEEEATTEPPSTTSQPSCSQFEGVSGQQGAALSSWPASHTPAASSTQCCVAASQTASHSSAEMRRNRFTTDHKGARRYACQIPDR